MSRIGKQTITFPATTEVAVVGRKLLVKGPKGELSRLLPSGVTVVLNGDTVEIRLDDKEREPSRGSSVAHLKNMIAGVNEPFHKKLIIEGIGYRAEVSGSTLTLALGFSHPVKMAIPSGVSIVVEKNLLTVSGIDKEAVGQFAANIRAKKVPEPYKGKGIRYADEVIKRKEGKRATAAA